MKVLKREAGKKLLGTCWICCGSKAYNPRDVPNNRLGGAEPRKQGIERCVVVALREASISFSYKKWDVAVGGMR